MSDDDSEPDEAPLLSTSLLWKIVGGLAALSVASLLLSLWRVALRRLAAQMAAPNRKSRSP